MATCSLVSFIFLFALTPKIPLPRSLQPVGFPDLLMHASAFALLTLLILPMARRAHLAVLGLVALAASLEAAQLILPHRTASALDLAGNFLGIALGWGLVALATRFIRARS